MRWYGEVYMGSSYFGRGHDPDDGNLPIKGWNAVNKLLPGCTGFETCYNRLYDFDAQAVISKPQIRLIANYLLCFIWLLL